MNLIYLSLGSNLSYPLHQIETALTAIDAIPYTTRIATSSLYRTPPYGNLDQPDYLNVAVGLETSLQPDALLDHTQHIEIEQGRIRKNERWEPRTLDIDIMLFGEQVINTSRLTVPHYDMHNRAFMIVPLIEIAPHLSLPNGGALADLLVLAELGHSNIRTWSD